MSFPHVSPALSVAACALALGLSGCAAVPLAQMAVTQMAPKPCLSASACQPGAAGGSLGDISSGVSASFHRLTTLVSDNQPAAPEVPAK